MTACMEHPYHNRESGKHTGQYPQSAKLVSNKLSKCYCNNFKNHQNTGTICLTIVLQTWGMFSQSGLTKLHMFFYVQSTFFQLDCLCNFQAGILSNKEAILFRGTLKELRSKISTMLKIHCVKCFSRNLAKIYKTTILTNFFRCMRSKSLTGGLLEPFHAGGNKRTHILKQIKKFQLKDC